MKKLYLLGFLGLFILSVMFTAESKAECSACNKKKSQTASVVNMMDPGCDSCGR